VLLSSGVHMLGAQPRADLSRKEKIEWRWIVSSKPNMGLVVDKEKIKSIDASS